MINLKEKTKTKQKQNKKCMINRVCKIREKLLVLYMIKCLCVCVWSGGCVGVCVYFPGEYKI